MSFADLVAIAGVLAIDYATTFHAGTFTSCKMDDSLVSSTHYTIT